MNQKLLQPMKEAGNPNQQQIPAAARHREQQILQGNLRPINRLNRQVATANVLLPTGEDR